MLKHVDTPPCSPHVEDVPAPATASERSVPLDLNAVVAYNVTAVRLLRGLTQDQVAERLARFTGHRLPQASISQMERAFYSERRRRFDAHDLYLLAKVFAVPVVYFLLPPPACLDRTIAATGDPLGSVLDDVFGNPASLGLVDRRLVEIAERVRETADSDTAHDVDPQVRARNLHVSRLSDFGCNARLREIAGLLRDLTDLHRNDAGTHPMPPAQR